MNILLIFFALPVATILISIVLEKILKSPILVAIFVFAVFLIVTFAAFDVNFLVATIAYTILAFITAGIVSLICDFIRNNENVNTNDIRNDRGSLGSSHKNLGNTIIDNDNIISKNNIRDVDINDLGNALNNRRRREGCRRL